MAVNLNWVDDEAYIDELDNRNKAIKLLKKIKERQGKEKAHWEDRVLKGYPAKVRVIDEKG